jgi:hypothetical protein
METFRALVLRQREEWQAGFPKARHWALFICLQANGIVTLRFALHFLPEFLEAVRSRLPQGGVLPLRRLSLCHQRFDAHNMLAILRDCSLECLEFHGCVISEGAFATDDFAVQKVVQCFARNKTLLGLAVDFASEHVAYYAAIIAENTCLKQLTIGKLEVHNGGPTTIPIPVADATISLLQSSNCPVLGQFLVDEWVLCANCSRYTNIADTRAIQFALLLSWVRLIPWPWPTSTSARYVRVVRT